MFRLPTPYTDVNVILYRLLDDVKSILGNQFVGMYLYGSLSSGDFNPESSDIDFIVATTDLLAKETVSRLETMHKKIWSSGLKWSAKLEGSYVPVVYLRRYEGSGPACPTVNEGRFYVHTRGSDWAIQLHVIREWGVVVEGPDPKSLIDPVSQEQIRQAVIGSLRDWWFPMLENPAWLVERGAEYHAFAVITMCRVLHALEHGTIVSKPVAAKWAKDQFGAPWDSLVEKALAPQHGIHDGFPNEALDFIRFTQEELMSSIITYRPYEDKDWKAICHIHDRARPDELIGSCDPRGFIPIEQDKEVEDLKRSTKFVATEGEKVVGFVGVDGDYLAWLYVDPDYYGKGIGRELLRMGIREIGEGAWTIVLDGNKNAIALYESEGFREVGRFDGDNNGYPCTCLKMKRVN